MPRAHYQKEGALQDEFHHMACLFKDGSDCRSTAQIEDFELLKPNDQKRIQAHIKVSASVASRPCHLRYTRQKRAEKPVFKCVAQT